MEVVTEPIIIKKVELLNKNSEKYFPARAFSLVLAMLEPHNVSICIKRKRNTKYGDFNPPNKKKLIPVITVNNDLNPYSFLITLLHEFAHFLVWKDGHFYAKPHGRTWKKHFSELMQTIISENIFPESLLPFITKHIRNPRATSCRHISLFRELSKFDTNQAGVFIGDLSDGDLFPDKGWSNF